MIGLKKAWTSLALFAAVMSPILFLGCAKEVGDIDRTQSIRLDKAAFAGVWYYVRTVADVPFSTSMTFQGETYAGSLQGAQKVVFDIQEDLLIAYPVWEVVDGVESKFRRVQIRKYWDNAHRGEFIDIYVGQPIAAWTITSHFDVIRDYNAQTGEQSNLIVENTTDRQWWERDYIRVDWNDEQIRDIGFLTGTAEARSLQYVEEQEQNPLSPDAPDFEEQYIGITTKYYAEPNPAGCAVWGLYRNDCVGATVKIRHSFRKANPAEDAITRNYTNREHMEKFGFFLADRYDFDPLYGYTESGRDYKAQLWNLWEKSQTWEQAKTDAGNPIKCHTQTDCPIGTRCIATEWFLDGQCMVGTPIAYKERGLRPIVYHMSHSHPGLTPTSPVLDDEGSPVTETEDGGVILYQGGHVLPNSSTGLPHPLVIEAYETADGWSKAFKETVSWLFYHEEKGTLNVADKREGSKACETHQDCLDKNANLLVDQFADTLATPEYACTVDADCPSGFGCLAAGNGCNADETVCNVCAQPVSCSANLPCPWGASCSQGQCENESGVKLLNKAEANEARAYTFVVFAGEDGKVQASRLTDRVLPSGISLQALTSGNQALVRFVNAAPGTTVTLRAITADPADSAQDTAVQNDPIFEDVGVYPSVRDEQERMLGFRTANYTDKNFPYTTRTAQKWRRLEVVSGGQVLATLYNVQLEAAKSYLFVYADGQIIASDAAHNVNGIRAINAIPASMHESVDMGIDSLVLGRMVEFGTVLPHVKPIVAGTNRFVVLTGGAHGDVTCYNDNTMGKCMGWGAIMDSSTQDEVKAIEESLPEMFVVCEPIYHGDDCTDEEIGNLAVYNDCRYSRRNDDGTISNPCKDLVAHPMGLKKIGDIRYNFFYWVEKAQAASPLGYGPSAADPEYGNCFYGIANVYGAPLYTQGRYAQDLLDLMNGNVSYEEVMTGEYVREYILSRQQEFPDPDDLESHFEGLMLGTTLSGEVVEHAHSHELQPIQLPPALRAIVDKLPVDQIKSHRDFVAAVNAPGLKPKFLPDFHPSHFSERSTRLQMVRDSWVADLLVNDEVRTAASGGALSPGMNASGDMAEAVYTAAIDPDQYYRLQSQRNYILSSHNVYMAEFTDDALLGLVQEIGCTTEKLEQGYDEVTSYIEATKLLEAKKAAGLTVEFVPGDNVCLSGEALMMILTARTYGGVLEHEVGHTVGLRHNFAASGDIFNYFDEWYTIREQERIMCYDEGGCDYSRGEVCSRKCASDADCPSIATCENIGGLNVCIDQTDERNDAVGWCMSPANAAVGEAQCSFNPGATAPGSPVKAWDGGACYTQTYCTKNIHCGTGQKCDSQFCVDQASGEVVREPAYVTSCTTNADCGAQGRCDNGQTNLTDPPLCLSYRFGVVPRPRYTKEEAESKRAEAQYSSIMDYGQKINGDFHGLGKYDHAAIKFGYGDLVEVYMDTAHIDEYVEGSKKAGDSLSTISFYRSSSSWMQSLNHPYRFLNFVLGIDYAPSWNRVVMPYQQVKLERAAQYDYLNRSVNTTYIEVPYEFCSDEFRGNGGCYYFDTGADDIEIVEHANDMLREYYLFDAFKRDRYSFGWGTAGLSYYARIRDRWMQPMRNSGLYAALYTHLFAGLGFWERFSKEPMSGYHFGYASKQAFQNLVGLVASPAPGSYEFDAATNSYINVSYDSGEAPGANAIDIEVGVGKFPYTTYDAKYGYHMYMHPLFVGSYWEKLAAVSVLTENDVTFLSDYVGEDLDIGIKSAIGFTSLYPTPIINLFGAIVADAPEFWAGVVDTDADGNLVYRARNALFPQRDAGKPTIQPSLNNLSFKALAGLYALSQVPAAFDPSITDSLGVTFRGHKSDYTLSEGLVWNEFEDPFGKKVYQALQPNYDDGRIAASWSLIDRANELKTQWLNAGDAETKATLASELNDVIDVLDMLRELTAIYGILDI